MIVRRADLDVASTCLRLGFSTDPITPKPPLNEIFVALIHSSQGVPLGRGGECTSPVSALTRHAPLCDSVGHIAVKDHDLSRGTVFEDASTGRHSSCRQTVPVRLRRHPRRYFPSFDRKHPITPMIPCNIVRHHDLSPRLSIPPFDVVRNSCCNDRKMVKFSVASASLSLSLSPAPLSKRFHGFPRIFPFPPPRQIAIIPSLRA